MYIRYGSIENNIDITQICLNKLCIDNVIYIPDKDHIRNLYFTDPLFGVKKSIFVFIEDKLYEYGDTKIYVCLNTNKVYTNNSIPNDIYKIFYEYSNSNVDINSKISLYYNKNIQTSKLVINDIFLNSDKKKILIFGLGYDSQLWYYINRNTYFIEDKDEYIKLNKKINPENIIKHNYNNISVKKSFNLSDEQIKKYPIPNKLLELSPFDIILIDGPEGSTKNSSGRLLPYFWSAKYLSKPGSLIYCDDCSRLLESYCIHKFFSKKIKKQISRDIPCMKIYI